MIEFLICALPRSGGQLLCDLLAQVGVGMPDEYLHPRQMADWMRAWDVSAAEYIPRLRAARSANGFFGMKVHWDQRESLAECWIEDFSEMFQVTPRCIFLSRADIIRQAISYSIADQTRVWQRRDGAEDRSCVRYSAVGIETRIEIFKGHARSWQAWFRQHHIVPYAVTYEDLDERRGETLRGVLEFLGAPIPNEMPAPRLQRQADALNEEFYARFIEGEVVPA